jgi:hypothetical protein
MPDHTKVTSLDVCRHIERLLQQQHDALLRDDLAAVDEKGQEITSFAAGLSHEQRQLLSQSMDNIRQMHDQMSLILTAKKDSTAAELATIRQKRSLNKSYRAYNE